jgi:hypothetical protein
MIRNKKFKVSEATKAARAELSALSCELNKTKALVAATCGVQLTTNELLLDTYKQKTGAKEFLRLQEWRELGYKVKKGEKSYRIWGSPIQVPKKSKHQGEAEADSFEHWPMCCLFHENQVELFVPAGSVSADEHPLLKTA